MMDRRQFVGSFAAAVASMRTSVLGEKIVQAARQQIGVTTSYDPAYRHIAYPNGDVAPNTGICADVVIRACRSALQRDLQQLVHEDMAAHFDAYPRAWGARHSDSNIDHRRVLNLQTFWTRKGARVWISSRRGSGDDFGSKCSAGDFVSWLINGSLPHVGVLGTVADNGQMTVIHNIGNGVEETPLSAFRGHPAVGRYRWPTD